MSVRIATSVFAAGFLVAAASAADEPDAPRSSAREALRARMAEDAKKTAPRPAAKPATAANSASAVAPGAAAAATAGSPAPVSTVPSAQPASAGAAAEKSSAPVTLLPQVEVKKTRITVLDQQLAEQEREIARERKNLKVSETDLALNDLKIAKPLAIFGGDSAQFRQRVASERVELMEAEKDLLEAIAHARTKEQKAELQTQLDQLREMRRQLDKTLR